MSQTRSRDWRWEDRGERGWWCVCDELQIEDGPHKRPARTDHKFSCDVTLYGPNATCNCGALPLPRESGSE
jgi:hypothetical protein